MTTEPTTTRVPGADAVMARANEIYRELKKWKGYPFMDGTRPTEIQSDSVKAAVMAIMEALQSLQQ